MKITVLLVLFLSPSLVFGAAATAEPQTLELSAKAQVEGATVPLGVVVSTDSTNVVLSAAKKEGATPVTFTLYVTPKPKPAPVATSTNAAAAVESSAKIQEGIAGISPAAAEATAPFFKRSISICSLFLVSSSATRGSFTLLPRFLSCTSSGGSSAAPAGLRIRLVFCASAKRPLRRMRWWSRPTLRSIGILRR